MAKKPVKTELSLGKRVVPLLAFASLVLGAPLHAQTVPVYSAVSKGYGVASQPYVQSTTVAIQPSPYTGYASYIAPLSTQPYHPAEAPTAVASPQVVCQPDPLQVPAQGPAFEDCRVISAAPGPAGVYRNYPDYGGYDSIGAPVLEVTEEAYGYGVAYENEPTLADHTGALADAEGAKNAPMELAWSMPESRFRATASVNIDLGYQLRYDLQPVSTDLDFRGFAAISIDRRDGKFFSQTEISDPLSSLKDAYLRASAPASGPLLAEAKLEDRAGKTFAVSLNGSNSALPAIRVRNPRGLSASGTVGLSGEYAADNWALGAALAYDVSPIAVQQPPTLSTANLYVSSRFGTLRGGRGVGLPYATRAFEVISGGGYSFADFGTYQVSYISPVLANTRVGVLLGLQTRAVAGSAEWQLTRGNNQFRAGAYADSSRSVQGELGYTRALGAQRFVGGTLYAGNDGNGESFFGIQGNLDIGKHTVQANLTQVASNNLGIVYGSSVTGQPILGLDINDRTGFNRQAQLNLEYRYSLTPNVQLYGTAEFINHRYYGSTYSYGGGVRAAF